MNIGALLKSFIYIVSASLLYPVLFLLVVLTIWVLAYSGAFFAEWVERTKVGKRERARAPNPVDVRSLAEKAPHRVRQYVESLEKLLTGGPNDVELEAENLLQEKTLAMWASLDRVKMFVRIGPGLGLIGTLIPMGTGLAALGQGDMTRLSADLVIAFTTTVVGLAIGMTCYFFYTIKRRWVEQDIKDMALITELLVENHKKGRTNHEISEKD